MQDQIQAQEISKFQVRISGDSVEEGVGGPIPLFDFCVRMVTSWEQGEYNPDEAQDDDNESEDEDLVVATGWLSLALSPNVEAIREIQSFDPEAYESLTVSITYLDANGAPVYTHSYQCDPTIEFDQSEGKLDEPIEVTLSLDYYDVDKFQLPTDSEIHTH